MAMTEEEQRAQELAIAKAVRDALVDRTLAEHSAHLEQINGSQLAMSRSLGSVDRKVDGLIMLAEEHANRTVKRWQLWTGIGGLVAAYGTIVALLISNHH